MPSGRRLTGRCLAAVAAGLLAVGTTTAAGAADGVRPEPGRPWFGPVLDWTRDLPADYADRLGETPSLYGQSVHYPLTADDRDYLAQFAELAATQGAVAVLSLEPQVALDELTADDAEVLADELARLDDRLDTHVLVRFAPEMNGSWVVWGQQPKAYVAAFRRVADAVHDSPASDHAEMVWSPAYGAGYPFGGSYGAVEPAGRRAAAQLDTDDNGVVDDRDDPYGPYFPGDDAVDWVGLSLYHFGARQDFGDNEVPAAGELEARLRERFGYGTRTARRSFSDRWVRPDRPLLLETSALYDTANPHGAPELGLKRAWWRQVLAAVDDRPAIGAISWLEVEREEAEIDGNLADWRATHTPALADGLRDDLAGSSVRLGPVTGVVDPGANGTTDSPDAEAPAGGGASPAWWAAGTVVLGAAWLALRLVRRRRTA
ncbi:hypothetical protein L2K70_02530 [Nocardioides KLBMP 9356]|uniref:GH26 domain-containing protein n=1 Tax=Nocardioides potassii TaxID=2911371 RepID=A0ABS9H7P9_9ACTN|nr:glycosyl hydrolase [Nocardioides potassii]MCF6376469.1 hypothetical protein [Nocardioides potassii]